MDTVFRVLSAAAAGNIDSDSNNIIFTIKDRKSYVTVVSKRQSKLSKLFNKGFERSVYWNEYKTKSENKNTTNEYRYFLESNFVGVSRLFVLVYSYRDAKSKIFKTQRYYLSKGINDNYNVIINGNTFLTKQFIQIWNDTKK